MHPRLTHLPFSDDSRSPGARGGDGSSPVTLFPAPSSGEDPSPPLIWNQVTLLPLPAIILSGGCAHSPTVDVLGSYFPAWMLCIVVGLVVTLIVRLLLIGFGIYPHLRLKPVIFSCMAAFFTLIIWLGFFKN